MSTPVPDPPPSELHLTAETFASRFEASAPVLWTIACAVLGRRTHVEDVIQEAAVIGLEKLDQFQPGTRFEAWMGRIVRFVALNHLRGRARRGEVSDEVLGQTPARRVAAPLDLEQSLDDELRAALLELRPIARACLLLKVVAELEYKQIAATLNIPEGTAMSHVHRARHLLRERLAEEVTR